MFRFVIFTLIAAAYGQQCDTRCRPTCARPNPPSDCPAPPPYDENDPCQCPPGFILTEAGGSCTQVEVCPDNLGCNDDPNAVVRQCPSPCPSTCDAPNTSLATCTKPCKLGCECSPGYIRSNETGTCILPDDCPKGNPCNRPNEEYTSCTVSCTPVYCPVDDVQRVSVCSFPSPCDAGCVCKFNHRRLSIANDTCIPAEDCPDVPCTRQNEKFFGCRPYCPREFCSFINQGCSPPIIRSCDPRCTCEDNFYKNGSDICVPKSECPQSS